MPSTQGIDHIGVIPKDIQTARHFFEHQLGLTYTGQETLETRGITTYFFSTSSDPQSPKIELLEPLNDQSEITKFIQTKGSGIHHVCLRVQDIDGIYADLINKNVTCIGQGPQPGAHNTRVLFIHPKSTGGILLELVESNI